MVTFLCPPFLFYLAILPDLVVVAFEFHSASISFKLSRLTVSNTKPTLSVSFIRLAGDVAHDDLEVRVLLEIASFWQG